MTSFRVLITIENLFWLGDASFRPEFGERAGLGDFRQARPGHKKQHPSLSTFNSLSPFGLANWKFSAAFPVRREAGCYLQPLL